MSKLIEIKKYLNNTSLFEKQQVLDELLKDFRLENDFKKFYEEEFKKDKQNLKEIVEKEVAFEYEGKIILLERDNKTLNNQLDNINESYKIQLNSAKSVLEVQLGKVNETLKDEIKEKQKIQMENAANIKQLKMNHEREKSSLFRQKEQLSNKIKNMELSLKSGDGHIYFMNSNYFVLNKNYVSTTILSNLLYLEMELLKSLEKITGFKDINKTINFKNNLYEYILMNYSGTILTESVVIDVFDYYKSLTLMISVDGNVFKYRPFDILKEEIHDNESFYTQIFKKEGDD